MNNTIEVIDLGNNAIGENGVKYICDSLKVNKSVKMSDEAFLKSIKDILNKKGIMLSDMIINGMD